MQTERAPFELETAELPERKQFAAEDVETRPAGFLAYVPLIAMTAICAPLASYGLARLAALAVDALGLRG